MPSYINNLTGSTAMADQDMVTAKPSNGMVDAICVTNAAQHSALKACTEVILQLRSLIVTAPALSGQSIAAARRAGSAEKKNSTLVNRLNQDPPPNALCRSCIPPWSTRRGRSVHL